MGRDIRGRFSSFKSYCRRVWHWIKVSAFVSLVLFITASFGAAFMSTSTVTATTVNLLPEKLEELKDDLVNRLADCENGHYTEDDAIVMYDNNAAGSLNGKNVFSFGEMQWKVSTIQHQVKLRDGHSITQKEAVLIALNTSEAKKLAKFTIFSGKDSKGVGHWHNCATKLGLYEEVKVIKKLSQ